MLKIKNIHTTIKGKEILKGISLKIKPGEIHVLMGPNGSGKSTLAHTLMGKLNYKVRGEVYMDKENIFKLEPFKRAKKGLFLSFQNPVSFDGISVFNLLKTAVKNPKLDILRFNKKLEDLCKILSLDKSFLQKPLNQDFSGGEKKKIELLQMLIFRPKYALIDEIDTGLDIDSLKIAAVQIKKLARNKTGILLITHYQRILKYLKPDFVHIMINGKIVKSDKSGLAKEIEKEGYKRYFKKTK